MNGKGLESLGLVNGSEIRVTLFPRLEGGLFPVMLSDPDWAGQHGFQGCSYTGRVFRD